VVGSINCNTFRIPVANATLNNEIYSFDFEFGPYLFTPLTDTRLRRSNLGRRVYSDDLCEDYWFDPRLFDAKTRATMIIPPIGWVIALINICVLFGTACCSCGSGGKDQLIIVGVIFMFLNVLFQGLMFLMLSSQLCSTLHPFFTLIFGSTEKGSCELNTGAYLVIASIVGFFLTGVVCIMVAGKSDGPQNSSNDEVAGKSDGPQNSSDDNK
jgi:hypothetical protein